MKISDYNLSFRGKMSLEQSLEIDKKYSIACKGAIISETEKTNFDGTVSKTYTLQLEMVDVIDEKGAVIRTSKGKSKSKKLRSTLFYKAQEENLDADKYYDSFMSKLLVPDNLDRVIEMLKK